MIKITIKSYLSNLKFIFTPIGVLTVFIIVALSIVYHNVAGAVTNLINTIQKIMEASSSDISAAGGAIYERAAQLDWNNLEEAMKIVTSEEWLTETLNAGAKAAFPESENLTEEIAASINACVDAVVANIYVLIILTATGVVVGFAILKFIITKNMVKRTFWQALLRTVIHTILNATIVALIIYIISLFKVGLIVNLIVTFSIYSVLSIFEAYLFNGIKKVPFKKVFNFKGIALLILSSILVIGFTVGLSFGIFYLMRNPAAYVLIASLILVAVVTNELLGETYIQTVVDKETIKPEDSLSIVNETENN